MLGTDRSIADSHSRARARMRRYAKEVNSLTILIPGNALLQAEGNLAIKSCGTGVLTPLRMLWHTARALRTDNVVLTVQDPFEIGMIGYLASIFSDAKLHVQVHIDFYNPYYSQESLRQRIQSLIAPYILRRANRVRVVSKRIATYLEESLHIPQSKIDNLPITSDLHELTNDSRSLSLRDKFNADAVILSMSRLVPQKNIPLLLNAFVRAHKEHPGTTLVIAGSGSEKDRLKALASRLGINNTVTWQPWIEAPASWIRGADVFVLSSNYEGWGMTVVEAAILGTPVVMTDVGAAGEVIENEVSGLVVPVGDEIALSQALLKVLSSPTHAAELSQAARQKAESLATGAAYDSAIVASWQKTLTI